MGQPDKPQAMGNGPRPSPVQTVRSPQSPRIVVVIAHTPVIDIDCPATCNTRQIRLEDTYEMRPVRDRRGTALEEQFAQPLLEVWSIARSIFDTHFFFFFDFIKNSP